MGEPVNKRHYDDQAYTRPSGRVVLPKPLRDELELAAGDTLELESRGEQITLRLVRGWCPYGKPELWVYRTGRHLTAATTDDATPGSRGSRSRKQESQVKAFFASSVLVAVFYGDHQYHGPSIECFLRIAKKQACCGEHSLAEVCSTPTRMPIK